MFKGRDVFVVFDDLTKHAWIYRQISLLLERAPGREAYPGDVFYLHSQLMERAGYLNEEWGGGSMTFFPVVEILQGDLTGYIPTNIISMTDGQLYFSTDLIKKGFMPAIDFGLSVSRIGNKAQWKAMREVSKTLRLDYIQYKELLKMTQMQGATLAEDVRKKIQRGEAINALINQYRNNPVPLECQVVFLYALHQGILDGLSQEQTKKFRRDICPEIEVRHPGTVNEIRAKQELSEGLKAKLQECFRDFKSKL